MIKYKLYKMNELKISLFKSIASEEFNENVANLIALITTPKTISDIVR